VNCYEYLYEINPNLVVEMEYPTGAFPIESVSESIQTCMQNLLNAQTLIIESTETATKPVSDNVEAENLIKENLASLAQQYGEENVMQTFSNPYDQALDKKIEAQILINFYKNILSLGNADAGIVIRYLGTILSTSNSKQAES